LVAAKPECSIAELRRIERKGRKEKILPIRDNMFSAGMDMADMAWEVKCREEDMKQRALENERHAIEDARRSVDEKAQQLQVLANQSALFAGFSMVSFFLVVGIPSMPKYLPVCPGEVVLSLIYLVCARVCVLGGGGEGTHRSGTAAK
jgi:hypothetical protein